MEVINSFQSFDPVVYLNLLAVDQARLMRHLPDPKKPTIAVIIPAYNEGKTIARVVREFRSSLPDAEIYVYDNNSSDNTAALARDAGATVRIEGLQGKGNVVRRMFADVEADVYVMVDGDGTYDARNAPQLVQRLVAENLDMVVGARISDDRNAYRRGHKFGNRLLNRIVQFAFAKQFVDMLSGYRAFSRRFIKTFPAAAAGFEVETELTVHALEMRLPCAEEPVPYSARPEGSESKLDTYSDGLQILWMIVRLFKRLKPFQFFGLIAVGFVVTSVILALPVFQTYFETGRVPRIPTAVLSATLMVLALISVTSGILLQSVSQASRELARLHYLGYAGPTSARQPLEPDAAAGNEPSPS
jgi:hypothetical protein